MGARNLSNRRAKKYNRAKANLGKADNILKNKVRPRKNTTSTLKQALAISGAGTKEIRAFVKLAKRHPILNNLQKKLAYLGMNFEDFLKRIDINKLLTSKFSPKGLINEIFILGDKVLVDLMKERANGSFVNLYRYQEKELANVIGNIANKVFRLKDFDKIPTSLATNFKTLPDNKLYFDFSMVRYDAGSGSLLIMIPGEIKEPRAAAELAKQFGRFVRRLSGAGEISFEIGGKTKRVKSSDVFYVKNNAAGIGRTEKRYGFKTGKVISEKTPVMEITHAKFKSTSSESGLKKDNQEFIRFLVRLDKDMNPTSIERALGDVKRQLLRMSKAELNKL